MRTRNKIILGGFGLTLIIILLCYFFDFPFPVFCCWFHNEVNDKLLNDDSTDWVCSEDEGYGYNPPPAYTCSGSAYPSCSGTCPSGQICVDTITGLCKCVNVEQDPTCTDTDGYANIFEYGICTDDTGMYGDICVNNQLFVSESWCEDGHCIGASYECPLPSVCYNGECMDCNEECTLDGYPWGGYYSGGISCDDFEHYIVEFQCCCFPITG